MIRLDIRNSNNIRVVVHEPTRKSRFSWLRKIGAWIIRKLLGAGK